MRPKLTKIMRVLKSTIQVARLLARGTRDLARWRRIARMRTSSVAGSSRLLKLSHPGHPASKIVGVNSPTHH